MSWPGLRLANAICSIAWAGSGWGVGMRSDTGLYPFSSATKDTTAGVPSGKVKLMMMMRRRRRRRRRVVNICLVNMFHPHLPPCLHPVFTVSLHVHPRLHLTNLTCLFTLVWSPSFLPSFLSPLTFPFFPLVQLIIFFPHRYLFVLHSHHGPKVTPIPSPPTPPTLHALSYPGPSSN